MRISTCALIAVALYSFGSMAYVYRWRGNARYASLKQFLRKSWPVFAPLNCFIYMTTNAFARKPFVNANYLENIDVIRNGWADIRAEAIALRGDGAFEATKSPGSVGYYDVGFRTFYKRGWSKYYLKWYGTVHASAQATCPRTVALLAQVPGIRGAMFSILPPGSELSIHSDPMACSFRYHLGLATPNDANCYINVDGISHAWRDGQDFIFDETYPHYVFNNTDQHRVILMCDVDRPMNLIGRMFNVLYRVIASGTLVPNTVEDRRGLFTVIFSGVAPLLNWSKQLRARNLVLYKLLNKVLNLILLALLLGTIYGTFCLLEFLVEM